MSKRKQSLNEAEIISREQKAGLPYAGVPPLQGREYEGAPVNDVPDDESLENPVGRVELRAPRNVTVESQTISFAPDGTQYVTVVVSFDEVEAADGYEHRIAKA